MAKVLQDPELADRGRAVIGEVFGLDMFDIGKNTALPSSLVDALSWSPGEENEFFAPGEFCRWPLRVWPIMKRPFIRLEGRVHCFDIFGLFDNFYRVLRRAILSFEPSYDGRWNDRQKAASEELPFTYLCCLLPGAQVYRSVHYRWSSPGGKLEWYEADGLVLFDDHLFVVEVKAGAFTYTSPANDLGAHLSSLRSLLRAPAQQGSRFVNYLESAPEVSIADVGHEEICRLRGADFRHITVCAVTLDAFTALAARAHHLGPIGIDLGPRAVWSLSIDDLRVYAELFDNLLMFLHLVEQRMHAGPSQYVDLNDEMEHLGLYLVQNNYSQYAPRAFDRATPRSTGELSPRCRGRLPRSAGGGHQSGAPREHRAPACPPALVLWRNGHDALCVVAIGAATKLSSQAAHAGGDDDQRGNGPPSRGVRIQ